MSHFGPVYQVLNPPYHLGDSVDAVFSFIDKLDSVARKQAMKEIRESDWFGAEQPVVRVSPHATRGFGL